jgi:hypothetical protein
MGYVSNWHDVLEKCVIDRRETAVCSLAGSGHFTVTELCGQFEISRKTGHKWLAHHAGGEMKALEDRSRRPHDKAGRKLDAKERREVGAWAFLSRSFDVRSRR